jgi:flagellar basal-body rod modification protein FlgD
MATSALGGITAPSTATQQSSMSQMKSEDFFKLLISELRNQDPLQPAKTADMISEVSQIRSIELSGNLTAALAQLTAQQRNVGAAGLLGKYVSGTVTDSDGQPQETAGVVTGVRFADDGGVVLELDTGQALLATQVQIVTTAEAAQAEAAAATNTTDSSATDKTGTQAKPTQAAASPSNKPSWLNLGGLLNL